MYKRVSTMNKRSLARVYCIQAFGKSVQCLDINVNFDLQS